MALTIVNRFCTALLYGAQALNDPKRRFPARSVASKADDTRKVEGVTEVLSRQLVNAHALQLDVLEKDMIL